MKNKNIKKKSSNETLNSNSAFEERYEESINRIIQEYKEQNNIDIITKEEVTDLFGESSIDPSYYQSKDGSIFAITDYECYMLHQGINVIEWPFHDFSAIFNFTEEGYDLGDAETMSLGEYESEINDQLNSEGIETSIESSAYSEQFNSICDRENFTFNDKQDVLIKEFEKSIIEAVQSIFSEAHQLTHLLFLLTNTGAREFFIFNDEQWRNQRWVKRTIYDLCQREDTIAFMLIISSNENRVAILLSSERIQDIFIYGVNIEKHTLEFVDRGSYDGDYAGYFKNR